jgi:glyoxylase-like metal-dependent hydrolase (beta-lactamase superfamily II)
MAADGTAVASANVILAGFVLGRSPGTLVRVPVLGYLIRGGPAPILVDSGYRSRAVIERLGITCHIGDEHRLERQLARFGLRVGDLGALVHTHLHIDHAGQDDRLPLTTPVIVNRRELEFAVSGVQGELYALEDTLHLVERLHTPGALQLLDLELTGPAEIAPGVTCAAIGAHTEGSLLVYVETGAGRVCICGDIIYSLQHQVVAPFGELPHGEPTPTGTHAASHREVKAAIKQVLSSCDVLCPGHHRPVRLARGQVVGQLRDQIPGPLTALSEAQTAS